jgi:hypothetical protein
MKFEKYIPDHDIRKRLENIYNDKMFTILIQAIDNHDRIEILKSLTTILDVEDFKELAQLFVDNPYNEDVSKQVNMALKIMPIPDDIKNNEMFKSLKSRLNILGAV